MPGLVAPRSLAVLSAAILLAGGASYYLTQEFPASPSRCTAHETFGVEGIVAYGNRTYCAETIDLGQPTTPGYVDNNSNVPYVYGPTASAVFLGFTFAAFAVEAPLNSWTNVTITEPNETVYHGGPYWLSPRGLQSNWWFTPDREAGVDDPFFYHNITLLVELGE